MEEGPAIVQNPGLEENVVVEIIPCKSKEIQTTYHTHTPMHIQSIDLWMHVSCTLTSTLSKP